MSQTSLMLRKSIEKQQYMYVAFMVDPGHRERIGNFSGWERNLVSKNRRKLRAEARQYRIYQSVGAKERVQYRLNGATSVRNAWKRKLLTRKWSWKATRKWGISKSEIKEKRKAKIKLINIEAIEDEIYRNVNKEKKSSINHQKERKYQNLR